MAILITGGRGFVGSHLIPFLKRKGCEVVLFEGDISDQKNIENFKVNGRIEAVVHLAAALDKKDEKIFDRVNVLGTENIINLCRRLNSGRLVFLSSIRTLSPLNNPYIDSKRKAEKIMINFGVPYIILRPSIIYGPKDKKNLNFLLKMAKISPLMPVFDFRMQPLYVGDLAEIIFASLRLPPNKILNITGPEIISFKDILKELKLLNYRFFSVYMPRLFPALMKLCAFLPFFPLTSWQIQSLLSNEIYESSPWEKLFGVKATPFKEGIHKAIYDGE